ncbi:hypothetical protein TCSYLVIO_002368 [Trypanosoma cruzi]|nr:hypothetical protein TCSYLVIO_002368 [Trypanosoma cruzi]KAF8279028.1 putative nuclease-like protein [Trypanosoma cruzi]PBJ73916.1 hypothetical protein BCY84_13363 [Trypanosoma cruzi cruzi]RNF20093.1 Thermonuclease precursor [Trypanosoma cruzi]
MNPGELADAMASPAPRRNYGYHISKWSYMMTSLVLLAAVLISWLQQEERSLIGRTLFVKPKFVLDGSSFYATTEDGKPVRLRLRLLEAPELDQPHGRRSRLHLSQLLLNRPAPDVLCRVTGVDDVGGLIADVFIPGNGSDPRSLKNVQEEMVRQGWAWAMEGGFAPNQKLRAIMNEAREAKRGLWEDERAEILYMDRLIRRRKLGLPSQAARQRQQHGGRSSPRFR